LCVRQQGYGPTYALTRFSDEFLERFPKTASRYSQRIEFIADELNNKGVAELERIATSFFIMNREGITDTGERAERLIAIKPHITEVQAREASIYVNGLLHRAERRFPSETPRAS
jgi:hypothetical protein